MNMHGTSYTSMNLIDFNESENMAAFMCLVKIDCVCNVSLTVVHFKKGQ